ncbi:mechanosensitive ion channel [Mucilaginibacter pallidiroseus]|uniref:Mechanosensitive ion channel n=1 Tax=Mucilaginibacter pallidiroseus TaxID=2599295 RepID=A0A563UJF5_9SPHI|nr:mechanosensitive ion channel domain-containing protein [Mucilaginibacter pallidiroseus]TWR31485.1 mechanosensitive ion channel [Mucilaginibacter pallidiroseus]
MEELLGAWSKQLPPWAWNLIIIAFILIIGVVIRYIAGLLLNYYKNKKEDEYSFLRSIVTHLSSSLNHFVPLLLTNVLLPFVAVQSRYLDDIKRWLGIFLLISFARLLMRAMRVLEDLIYHKYDLNKEDNLKERKIRTQLQFVRKVAAVFIFIITLSLILLSFDSVRKLGAGLLTGVGIGGVIIGFAAQKSLGNLLAGFQIAFTQPIRIDDVLVVEGEWGKVEEITLTYVVLNIWDQRRLILPINYFIEKPFQNWTRTTSQILGTVFLYVDYNVPTDALRDELTRLLNLSPLWDKRVGILQVTDTKESTVELRALVSARNSSQAFDLRCYVRENLIKYLNSNYPDSLSKRRELVTLAKDTLNEPTDAANIDGN